MCRKPSLPARRPCSRKWKRVGQAWWTSGCANRAAPSSGSSASMSSKVNWSAKELPLEANLRGLQDELNHAMAEDRAAIQKDIEQTKTRLKATQDQAKARLDQARAEMDARVTALQDQLRAAGDRAK